MSDTPLPPSIPAKVSSNGKEIWDWAHAFSEHIHREDAIAKLYNKIHAAATCGSCDKWMHSRVCPREKLMPTGYNRGPSCDDLVGRCPIYTEKNWHKNFRAEQQAEMEKLISQRPKKGTNDV